MFRSRRLPASVQKVQSGETATLYSYHTVRNTTSMVKPYSTVYRARAQLLSVSRMRCCSESRMRAVLYAPAPRGGIFVLYRCFTTTIPQLQFPVAAHIHLADRSMDFAELRQASEALQRGCESHGWPRTAKGRCGPHGTLTAPLLSSASFFYRSHFFVYHRYVPCSRSALPPSDVVALRAPHSTPPISESSATVGFDVHMRSMARRVRKAAM